MRRFEFAGVPGSFFEIEVRGSELWVAFGARDRKPVHKPRAQPSADAARAELDRLVGMHLAKGYVEVAIPIEAPPPPPPPPRPVTVVPPAERARRDQLERIARQRAWTAARDPTLEAECERSDDPAVHSVLADWLTKQGDPRGEIANVFLRGEVDHATRLAQTLAGELAVVELRHGWPWKLHVSARWTPAFDEGEPDAIEVELDRRVRDVLASPIATTVRALKLGLPGDGDWTPALEAVAASPIASQLESLELDASDKLVRNRDDLAGRWDHGTHELGYDDVTPLDVSAQAALLFRLEHVGFSGIEKLWAKLPRLRRLVIDAPFGGDFGVFASSSLVELVVRSDYMRGARSLSRAHLPALRSLEIPTWGTVVPDLLASRLLDPVTHLALIGFDEATLAALAASPILQRLSSLALGEQYFPVDWLVEHAAQFRHLRPLDLTHSLLTEEQREAIRERLDNAILPPANASPPLLPARYIDASE